MNQLQMLVKNLVEYPPVLRQPDYQRVTRAARGSVRVKPRAIFAGDVLVSLRELKNLSITEVAKALDLARTTYSRYEKNKHKMPFDLYKKAVAFLEGVGK